MKNSRSLRLVLSRGLLGSALLASPVFALSTAELDSLRTKADRGNAIAQYNLGLAYADRGESIYDPAQAYAWLSVASANGTNGKALSDLTSQLTPAQLADGKNRLAALAARSASPISAPASPIATAEQTKPAPTPIAVPSADTDPDQKKLSAELAAAWKENELLKSGLSAQLADANKRVSIAEAALASKDRQIASLQTRFNQATAATEAAPVAISAELASLRTERDQLQTAATNTAAELATLRAEIASSKATASAPANRLSFGNDDLTNANEKIATLTKHLDETHQKLNPLKADRDRLAESVKILTEERDALTTQLGAAKAVLPDATVPAVVTAPIPAVPAPPVTPDADSAARIADLEKAKLETETKLEAALRSFTLQQAEIERLQKALASIDEERALTFTKLENATAELVSLRPQANSAATVSAEAEALRTQLAEARQTVSEQAAALNTANQNLADARKTIDTATTDLVATRDQLRQTQSQAASSAVEAQQLKTRLALVGNLPAGNSPSRPGSAPTISLNLPPATAATPTPAPAPAPARVETPAGPRIHTVSSGDSLSRISKQYYGTAGRWNEILQANRGVISNPDSLTLGTRLRIP